MFSRIALVLAVGLVSVSGQVPETPKGTGVITGTVLASGEPVRKAIVNLMWRGQPRSWAAVQTDGSGRFTFSSLPPGDYDLTASHPSVGNAVYGAENGGGGGAKTLTLADGETKRGLVLHMMRLGMISGRVMDSDGEPVVAAEVTALREAWPRGKRDLIPRMTARTNDRGEYRIVNLEPGKYYLAASASSRTAGPVILPNAPVSALAKQYYGGITDWQRAAPLVLNSGNQLRGIDFRLQPVQTFTLRGRVTGVPNAGDAPPAPSAPPTGQGVVRPTPPAGMSVHVQLITSGEGAQNRYMMGAGANPPDYGFQIPGVTPGRYLVSAVAMAGPKSHSALQQIDVQSDPGEITIALAPPVSITGRVRVEGEGAQDLKALTVTLTRGQMGAPVGPGTVSAKVDEQGKFVIDPVSPGVWDINVTPIPKGGYIKSMKLGEKDVLTQEMEIGATPPEALSLVVSSRGATVSGTIEPESDLSRVMVLLAPVGKFSHVISFYASTIANKGKFELKGITPGTYKLFAWLMPTTGFDARNPEFVQRLGASSGEAFEIAEGVSIEKHPKLIPAEVVQEAIP